MEGPFLQVVTWKRWGEIQIQHKKEFSSQWEQLFIGIISAVVDFPTLDTSGSAGKGAGLSFLNHAFAKKI